MKKTQAAAKSGRRGFLKGAAAGAAALVAKPQPAEAQQPAQQAQAPQAQRGVTPQPSAAQAAQGLSIWSILVFPALFTAGMTLLDTADSILMLGAYGWAFIKPIRKLYYNLTITAASVLVAVVVGGLETLNLIGDQLGLTDGGGFWGAIGALNDNFGVLGYCIVGIFALAWIVSVIVYRINGYDEIEATIS